MKYFVSTTSSDNNVDEYNSLGTDEIGFTLLHFAASAGSITLMDKLLSIVDLNIPTWADETPLFLAAEAGHAEMVQRLLSKGAGMEIPDTRGFTPILIAAKNGHDEVVRHLIQFNANIEACDRFGSTPIFLAAAFGHIEVVKLLHIAGANIHLMRRGLTPLAVALYRDRKDVVEFLSNSGANHFVPSLNSLLQWLAAYGSETDYHSSVTAQIHKWLEDGKYSLDTAIEYGNASTTKAIVKYKPVMACHYPQFTAAYYRQPRVLLEMLHNPLVYLDVVERAPLNKPLIQIAVEQGHAGVVQILVNCEAFANDATLTTAVSTGNKKILQILLENGAVPSGCFYEPVIKGDVTTLSMLLQYGKPPDDCINLAAYNGQLEVVRMLLNSGANVNEHGVFTPSGYANDTPLISAVKGGHEEVARLLLQNGADLNYRGVAGSALVQARYRPHPGLVKLLQDYGAIDDDSANFSNEDAINIVVH